MSLANPKLTSLYKVQRGLMSCLALAGGSDYNIVSKSGARSTFTEKMGLDRIRYRVFRPSSQVTIFPDTLNTKFFFILSRSPLIGSLLRVEGDDQNLRLG